MSLVHDSETKELFVLDALDSPEFQSERFLSLNGVLNERTLSVDTNKANKLVGVLLNLQRDVYEKITDSVGSLS